MLITWPPFEGGGSALTEARSAMLISAGVRPFRQQPRISDPDLVPAESAATEQDDGPGQNCWTRSPGCDGASKTLPVMRMICCASSSNRIH